MLIKANRNIYKYNRVINTLGRIDNKIVIFGTVKINGIVDFYDLKNLVIIKEFKTNEKAEEVLENIMDFYYKAKHERIENNSIYNI